MTEWNLAQDLPSECREASPRTVGHQSKFGQENGREVNHDNSNWRITKKNLSVTPDSGTTRDQEQPIGIDSTRSPAPPT